MKRAAGQPFSFKDFLTYVIANGDFPLYDRWVKTFDPDTQITDAESYIDWLGKRNPEVAETIRLKDVETFGNIVEEADAEPTLFSEGYCARSRGEGRLGDCCNSDKKGRGCLKDANLKCAMQEVNDVDQQRILWAKGERCIDEEDCGEEIAEKDGGGEWKCYAHSVKTVALAAFATALALLEL